MKSLLELLGFPSVQQRDSVRFYWAKDLPYKTRISLFFSLLIIGLALQIATLLPWFGLPFLIAASVLMAVKGYDSRVRLKAYTKDAQWTQVPITKFVELEDFRKRHQRWDRDLLDISNWLGCFAFIGFICAGGLLSLLLGFIARDKGVALILATDWVVVVVPFWFTGLRSILKHANLEIRIKLVLTLYDYFIKIKEDPDEFVPQLMLGKGKDNKTVPVDARFLVRFVGMPEAFYGLQAQINLNVVQGTSYPYFYCVLVAKPGFGLGSYKKTVTTTSKIICEYQTDANAEVLIIRQKTTKTSGYHTNKKQCEEILKSALIAGRLISRAKA